MTCNKRLVCYSLFVPLLFFNEPLGCPATFRSCCQRNGWQQADIFILVRVLSGNLVSGLYSIHHAGEEYSSNIQKYMIQTRQKLAEYFAYKILS